MVDQLDLILGAQCRPKEGAGRLIGVLRRLVLAHAPLSNDTLMKECLPA